MIGKKRENPRRTPTRGPKLPGAELLQRQKVAAARRAILERRQTSGSGDVTQADVDLAAQVLVDERLRPHPRILLPITGGSLSTVTPLLEDWFARFALRGVDPHAPGLDLPTRVSLNVQLLVAQLAAAVRDQVSGTPDPMQALVAAAQLGQHQALRAQVTALEAQREQLTQSLQAMTYRVAELEERLQTRQAAVSELNQVVTRLTDTLAQVRPDASAAAYKEHHALQSLITEVSRLRTSMQRNRRQKAPAPSKRKAKAPHRKSPRTVSGRKRSSRESRPRRNSRSRR